jgi:hypothetical protein
MVALPLSSRRVIIRVPAVTRQIVPFRPISLPIPPQNAGFIAVSRLPTDDETAMVASQSGP